LTSPSTLALLYTPSNEHFGIVPIEAGACGLPVLAVNSGGPVETVVDLDSGSAGGGTGLLREPVVEEWAKAIARLVQLDPKERERISQAAKKRVTEKFSSDTLGRELEEACNQAFSRGDVHVQIGDKLIWYGAGLACMAGMALITTIAFS
jgi:alpha-1,3/alpha-1,6-mannosyltransferase